MVFTDLEKPTLKVSVFHTFPADTVFPDLDREPGWKQTKVLGTGEDNGIRYEFRLYEQQPVSDGKGGI